MASKKMTAVLSAPEETITDVRDKILKCLEKEERNLNWLCRKIGASYSTMYACFVHKTCDVTDEKLALINQVLHTKFKK